MTEQIIQAENDMITVELVPDERDDRCWVLLAHLADYLHVTFGLELDCDTVLVGLVYARPEERAERAPAGPQLTGG